MARAPAFQFYPGDWLASPRVSAMTLEAQGAYFRLLCYQWQDPDCGIPSDERKIGKLIGRPWSRVRDSVLAMFAPHPGLSSKLANPRLLMERNKQLERKKKLSEAGQDGADKRWGGHTEAIAEPMAKPMAPDSSSSSSSSSSSFSSSSPSSTSPSGESPPPPSSPSAEEDDTQPDISIPRKPKKPDAPFEAIVAIYHEECPTMRRVVKVTKKLRSRMNKLWHDPPELQETDTRTLDGMRALFRRTGASLWLTGRRAGKNGPWTKCSFFWIIGPGLERIDQGNYDDSDQPGKFRNHVDDLFESMRRPETMTATLVEDDDGREP